MADGFRLFIDTQGKSVDEIKKGIRALLERRSDAPETSAAQESGEPADEGELAQRELIRTKIANLAERSREETEQPYDESLHEEHIPAETAPRGYSAQKIPPRAARDISYVPKKQPQTLRGDELAFAPDLFPIKMSEDDREINAKITEMRSLNEVFYNGFLVKQCAQISMVRQGEFLAALTDSYEHRAFCGIQRPIYGAMSNSQLRTFITWRTKARNGVFEVTDPPYVMLYCYELLNKIGVLSSADAFSRLMEVSEKCGGFAPEVKKLMPRWLKDFYAFNDIAAQYPDISQCLKTSGGLYDDEAALLRKDYAGRLGYLMDNSAYDIKGSAFFSEETQPLLDGAAGAVLAALDGWLGERGISLFELICGKLKKQYGWEPFSGAYVNLDRMDGFREVKINEVERYCMKRGEPVLECFEAAPYRGFIGYVLKRVEAVLRRMTGFRHKITPSENMLMADFRNREKLAAAVKDPAFGACIDEAAERWCRERGIAPPIKEKRTRKAAAESDEPVQPVRVEIDVSRLSRIREESDEIAKRLIIEDEGLPAEEIERLAGQVDDDNYSERVFAAQESAEDSHPGADGAGETAGAAANAPKAVCTGAQTVPLYDFSELPAVWRGFAQALDEQQLAVLAALTRGTEEDVCRSRGIFPEMVYEEINTAALDAMGDIVIEGGELIPDYEREIRRIVKLADI